MLGKGICGNERKENISGGYFRIKEQAGKVGRDLGGTEDEGSEI